MKTYLTLVTCAEYVQGAIVLCRSIRMTGSEYPVSVLITMDVPEEEQKLLRGVFDQVVVVDVIESNDTENLQLLGRPDLVETLTKIQIWKQTQWEKVVFLDADTLVLLNVDCLFDYSEFSACADSGWPDCFNSGVFVCCPNAITYHSLFSLFRSCGTFDGGDQGLLNDYFKNWNRMPFVFNVTPTAVYSYAPAFKRYKDDIKILHFIGQEKPWRCQRIDGRLSDFSGSEEMATLVYRWWSVYDAYIEESNPCSKQVEEIEEPISLLTEQRSAAASDFSRYMDELKETRPENHWTISHPSAVRIDLPVLEITNPPIVPHPFDHAYLETKLPLKPVRWTPDDVNLRSPTATPNDDLPTLVIQRQDTPMPSPSPSPTWPTPKLSKTRLHEYKANWNETELKKKPKSLLKRISGIFKKK